MIKLLTEILLIIIHCAVVVLLLICWCETYHLLRQNKYKNKKRPIWLHKGNGMVNHTHVAVAQGNRLVESRVLLHPIMMLHFRTRGEVQALNCMFLAQTWQFSYIKEKNDHSPVIKESTGLSKQQ